MTEVTQRLESAANECIKSYKAWQGDKRDSSIRESLMESVHELRKAAARLEIELAISERDMKKSKPIPIPPHRSSRKKGGDNPHDDGDSADDGIGNASDNANKGAAGGSGRKGSSGRRGGRKKEA